MKAKLYYIFSGDVIGNYTLNVDGKISIDTVEKLVRDAKRNFKLPGKLFTIVTEKQETFHVCKIGNVWKSYLLKGPKDEEL